MTLPSCPHRLHPASALALACGLLVLAVPPAASAAAAAGGARKAAPKKAAEPKAAAAPKPATGRRSAAGRKAAPAAAAPALAAATPEQIDAAQRVYYGFYECEFKQSLDVSASARHPHYVELKLPNSTEHLMKPVLSSTGAVRLEDVKGSLLMVQIAAKSMVLNVKSGQRLVDDCVSLAQRELMLDAKRREAAGAASAPDAPSLLGTSTGTGTGTGTGAAAPDASPSMAPAGPATSAPGGEASAPSMPAPSAPAGR